MQLNVSKCKSMQISRPTDKTNACLYFLDNVALLPVNCYKYLGVHISNDLSWNTHIEYVISNSNRMLGYLRRNFSSVSTSLKLNLYKTLVRSKLEYACALWDPHQVTLIHCLESIQNRAARYILSSYSRTASVSTMKKTVNLPDLSVRRKCSRLCLFHKIYHHNPTLKEQLITSPHYISSRTDHSCKVGLPSCRTNVYNDSFIPKTSVQWNHLPAAIASITDATLFKTAVHNTYCS